MTPTQMLPSSYPLKVNLARIEQTVAEAFSMHVKDMHKRTRACRYSWPRAVAMWLMCERNATFVEAGKWYRMDHSSAAYSVKRVKDAMECYPKLRAELQQLRNRLD